MNIQKEIEAFDLWWEGNAIAMMCEEDEALKIWQAAKARVVPEVLKKFCNEHKDPAWRGCLTEYDKGYSDCCIAVLEMIQAQGPVND